MAGSTVEVFSTSHRPNLVSCLFLCAFLHLGLLLTVWVLLWVVFVACSIVLLLLPPTPTQRR
jgi:hypothetical protein